MSTKRPSIVVISDIIQKYIGSDYDAIKAVSDNLAAILATTGLTELVDYALQGFPQETLDDLLRALTQQVTENTDSLNDLPGLNSGIASNTSAIADISLQLEQFITTILSGKTYQGGYDATLNIPNLVTPPLNTVTQGAVYDVIVGGTFLGTPVVVGDTLRARITNPVLITDWVIIPFFIAAASIKVQYESNPQTNEFNDTEKADLASLTDGSNADSFHTHDVDSLDDVYSRGNAIAITDAKGSVTLNNTGQTIPALKLIGNATFPTTNLGSGLHTDLDGTLYSYDGTRSKWLSVAEQVYHFGKEGLADNMYLDFASVISTNYGYGMPRNGTIIAVRARGRKTLDKAMRIELNGSNVLDFSLVGGEFTSTTEDIDFTVNDQLQLFVRAVGDEVRDPIVSLYIKWRK